MDYSNLYPIVQDLTETEYVKGNQLGTPPPQDLTDTECSSSDSPSSSWCDYSNGCWDLRELIYPPASTSSLTLSPQRERSTLSSKSDHPLHRTLEPAFSEPDWIAEDDRAEAEEATADRQVLFDDIYVLTRQISRGSTSTVWECVHRSTGTRHAAKIIDRRNLSVRDDDAVYREIASLELLSREAPGVLHLEQVFDEPERFYIVTDYADGGNLLTRIVQKKRLTEDDVRDLARGLLQGLKYLHSNDICHRNLKPENILLGGTGFSDVMIADFGLAAKLYSDADGNVMLLTDRCGTSSYASPESLQRIPYDYQTDMWSLGVVLYCCIAGYLPFTDINKRSLHSKICKADYSFNSGDWKDISRDGKRFISGLLHVDPQVRMTANEALQHAWLNREEVQQKTQTQSRRLSGRTLRKGGGGGGSGRRKRNSFFKSWRSSNKNKHEHSPLEDEESLQTTESSSFSREPSENRIKYHFA